MATQRALSGERVVRRRRRSGCENHPSIMGRSWHHVVVWASGRTVASVRTGAGIVRGAIVCIRGRRRASLGEGPQGSCVNFECPAVTSRGGRETAVVGPEGQTLASSGVGLVAQEPVVVRFGSPGVLLQLRGIEDGMACEPSSLRERSARQVHRRAGEMTPES